MTEDRFSQDIQQLLRRLGVTENYAGFFPTVYAIQLSINDPTRLHLITKLIYPDVAWRYSSTWRAVERNIRTVVSVAWGKNPQLLCELAGHQLTSKPKNASFLAIVANSYGKDSTT